MNDIIEATPNQPPVLAQPQDQATAMLAMIERAASNPAVDINKLERLMEMAQKLRTDQARAAYAAALAEAQAELPVIGERGGITDKQGKVTSTYALWEDVNRALLPTLKKYGFAISFRTRSDDKSVSVAGVLTHRDGHSESTEISLPFDQTGSKNAVQAVASSISYGQRYTARALLNFSTANDPADDDGQAAGNPPPPQLVTAEQVADWESRCTKTKTSAAKITAFIGVKSLAEVPANRAVDVENILKDRERAIANKGA